MGTILTNRLRGAGAFIGVLALAAGCGDDSSDAAASDGGADDRPTIAVTTGILGDVTSEIAGEEAHVETIMPAGADPHEYEPSTRTAEEMLEADLLVVNGLNFEEGMTGLIDRASDTGVEVFTFADHVAVIEEDDGHGHEEDDGHGHEEDDGHGHEEDDGHGHGPEDPHLWTDPTRMRAAVEELGDTIADLEGVDADVIAAQVDSYLEALDELDSEIEALVDDIPEDRRLLVTNHEVFAYFGDRYGFEILGTVIPSQTTLAEPSASDLEDLVEVIEDHDLPAIFAETTHAGNLAETVAQSVGEVEVVELYSESLGEEGSGAETYIGMMRTNATLIAEALG